MSVASAGSKRSTERRSTSQHLGRRLRTVLVTPRAGFRSALRGDVAAAAASPATAFMVLLAGVSTMTLWLKVTSLVRLADRPASETTWDKVLPGLALGGVLGIAAYLIWARLAPHIARDDDPRLRDRLRLAWAFSDFPLAAYALVILPLDLLFVGPEVFATDRPDATFARVWSALSVALLLSAAVWSVFLFIRGVEAARPRSRTALVVSAAVAVWFFYALLLVKELLL